MADLDLAHHILRWYRRMTVAAARTSRLKAHAQGWRLP